LLLGAALLSFSSVGESSVAGRSIANDALRSRREVCVAIDEKERKWRRQLVQKHVAAENAHDLTAIMATFAPHAINVVNGVANTTPESIRQQHALFGLSAQPGILSNLKVVHEVEHFTDEEIIYEGHFAGVHTGAAPGFPPPSGRALELPYVVVYRFDHSGLLVSESARIELSGLFSPSTGGATP
jgi:hypothetical protein